ncbi:MAG: 4-hydroxythreonine-4-phosphate dehydrogenase PdxA [Phycisphaerae bacterium]
MNSASPHPDAAPRRPTIGITMGDPAGIGAEVIVKALCDESLRRAARFIIYGLHEHISYAADLAEISPYWFRLPHETVDRIESGVVVADFDELPAAAPAAGTPRPTADHGVASMRFCDAAIAALQRARLDAVVTGPIHKTAWRLAGYNFPGHTELFAARFHSRRVTMMFAAGELRVALASVHEPLFELRNGFTIGRVHQPIDLLDEALRRWFGLAEPRIAVCGLNPHAGEDGAFGDEEQRVIEPAIQMARQTGAHVFGPFPADTLFRRAAQGEFDGVVAMYHDQGLIPIKLLAFHQAVNLTLGLPIIRTSVDHGTAYDIAGRNLADAGSMKAAIKLAIDLAQRRVVAPPADAAVAVREGVISADEA